MLNSEIVKFFRETPCGYMQKIAPVYKEPEFNNGRAHFLAPEKKLFHIKISTLTFNLSVIWMITLFLYIALYNNWLKKIVQRWSHG